MSEMAPNDDNGQQPPQQQEQLSGSNGKPVYLWSKPIDTQGSATTTADGNETSPAPGRPTFGDAVSTIKKEDFANVVQTPCARQGFITGIAFGAAFGGLSLVARGAVHKAANWAVGMFVLGSTVSYEYCQYQRRAERHQMKRNIEIVTSKRREFEQQRVEEQAQKIKEERDRMDAQKKQWYKFW